MFQVKICGVTTIADALAALDAGADAIGLNFYRKSPRYIDPSSGAKIAESIGQRAVKVGVFVNSPPEEVRAIAAECSLDLVQLHGDEAPADLLALRGLTLMRAFRVAGELDSVTRYLADCAAIEALPRLVLVDAALPGQYGGSGKTADWPLLSDGRAGLHGLPLVLAGGLNPENVAAAIETVRPLAVDVASGVEASRGKKSPDLMTAFVRAAKGAFAKAASPEIAN